jgi:hypothetical protein
MPEDVCDITLAKVPVLAIGCCSAAVRDALPTTVLYRCLNTSRAAHTSANGGWRAV